MSREQFRFNRAAAAHVYLDAGIYGTNEQDVSKDDEDTDVDSQHDRGAAGNTGIRSNQQFSFHKLSSHSDKLESNGSFIIKIRTLFTMSQMQTILNSN